MFALVFKNNIPDSFVFCSVLYKENPVSVNPAF